MVAVAEAMRVRLMKRTMMMRVVVLKLVGETKTGQERMMKLGVAADVVVSGVVTVVCCSCCCEC